MKDLTKNDYKQILTYYNKPIPKTKELIQKHAEEILSTKLCKCIKKVDNKNEGRSIGICTKTIFNSKGYTRGKFNCRGKSTVKFKKNNKTKKIKVL